jgi:hypothetical protein
MRIVTIRGTAAGPTPWIVVDRYVSGYILGIGVKLSSNGNLTYGVEYTLDNLLQEERPLGITRVAGTATVNKINHGMSAADYVHVMSAGAPFDGEFPILAVTDQNNFTYTVANSGPLAAPFYTTMTTARIFAYAGFAASTTSKAIVDFTPVVAVRLNVSAFTAGYADLTVDHAGMTG